jgi:small conductance mechanosensitive channel
MDDANLNTTEYRRILIESTGKLSSDILYREVFTQLAQRWIKKSLTYIEHNGINFIFNAFAFIGIIIIFMLIAKLTQGILRKSFNASQNQSTLLEAMLTTLICRSIIFVGILIALAQLGISLGPLLAGLGIAGVIIGFALQDTLGNFASGIMIIFYRPYDVGDMIVVGGIYGKVESMNLVSSTVLTIDNQTLVIPNSKIWGDVIKNVTHQKTRRVDMEFHAPLSEDVDRMLALFKDITHAHRLALDSPEPLIRLDRIERDSLVFIVKPWVKTTDYWEVYWDIQEAVKRRFDAEAINFPSRHITVQQA